MKTRTCQILTIGAALWLAPLASTLAQSNWETTDAALPAAGRDIVADPAGNFIGLNLDYTTTNAITSVVRSSDHGVTWATVGSIGGYALDLTVAADGALFASGNRTVTVSGRAVMWQSLDSGATWTQLDPWAGQSGTFLCLDVAAGNGSAMYLCGYVSGSGRWIVRKGLRSAGGIAWSTVDSFPGKQADSICVRPGAASQPDEVLVTGMGPGLWTTRRSADSGLTWATVDSYSTGLGIGGYSGVATGPNNSIYAVARTAQTISVTNWVIVRKKLTPVVTTTTEYGWLVRRSTNGGASWSSVDYVAGGWPGNGPITVDAFGRVFVAGFNENTSPRTWLVRGSSDGGTTWVTTDSFLPAGATSAQAWAVGSDAFGNVCVTGEATIGGLNVAPIRRLAAP
jgi:hypothetical protein